MTPIIGRRARPGGPAPLNSFGIGFGLAGLAGTWTAAHATLGLPVIIGDGLWWLVAVVWVLSVLNYLVRIHRYEGSIGADLRNPVQSPFAALVPATLSLFGAHLYQSMPPLGETLVWLSTAAALLFGAWFLAQLLAGERTFEQLHPGYLLPTVAAALISGQSAATIGAMQVAIAAIGAGVLFWFLVGAAVLARLVSRPTLAVTLVPTLAIFSAPPAVAGNAWFIVNGGIPDTVETLLLGVLVPLLLVQIMLIDRYRRLDFTLGLWALTFTAASSATFALHWLSITASPVSAPIAFGILLAVTALIVAIGIRSILFLYAQACSYRRLPLAMKRRQTVI